MRRLLLSVFVMCVVASPALAHGGHAVTSARVGEIVTMPAPPPAAKGQTIRATYSKKRLRLVTTVRSPSGWQFRFRALTPGVSKVTLRLIGVKGDVRGTIATEVRITTRR